MLSEFGTGDSPPPSTVSIEAEAHRDEPVEVSTCNLCAAIFPHLPKNFVYLLPSYHAALIELLELRQQMKDYWVRFLLWIGIIDWPWRPFVWETMAFELAIRGRRIVGWPMGVPFPLPPSRVTDRGFLGLTANMLRALTEAFDNISNPLWVQALNDQDRLGLLAGTVAVFVRLDGVAYYLPAPGTRARREIDLRLWASPS